MRSIFIFLGLIGLFLGWNLPNHYPLWTTFHGELIAAAGACLLFIGTLCSQAPFSLRFEQPRTRSRLSPVRLALPPAARAWLLVGVLAPLQYLAGLFDFYGDALLGFLYALGAAISVYIGYLWAAQAGRAKVLRALFLTVLLAGLAAGGAAFWQWMRLPTAGWWAMELIESRPYGNFAQPNLFGLFMVMGVVAATALFEMRVLQHRLSYYLVLVFFGWAMLISESRASALAMLSVAVFWFITNRRVPTRLRWYEVVAALGLGWGVSRSLVNIETALYLKATVARVTLEVGPREAIWLQFWAAIKAHPWAGYGFGQGVAALREVAAHTGPARNTIYAHSFVLDLMVWVGVPLGLILTAALSRWMLGWLRKVDRAESMAQRHWVFAFWLALAVQSLLEFPYAHTFFLLPAALLAGAITPMPWGAANSPSPPRYVASRAALALAAVAAGLLALTAWDYLQFETEFRANRFDKGRFEYPAEHDVHRGPVMLDQLAALNASARYQIERGMPLEQIERLGHLARRFHLLPTRVDYAKALALNGRPAEAQAEMQMIRGIYHPALWAKIERDWLDWQEQHRSELTPLR